MTDARRAAKPWTEPLSAADTAISVCLPKVGRIEIPIGDTVREIATGFVVGDGLLGQPGLRRSSAGGFGSYIPEITAAG